MFFSPKQVAENLHVSSSTVRRYAATFGDLLSAHANPESGKRRSFTTADVEKLRLIQGYLAAGLSEQDTRAQLITHEPVTVLLRESSETTYGSSIEHTLSVLADQKHLLEVQARQIADQSQRLTQQDAKIARLEARLDHLGQEVETLKASQG